MEGKPKDDYKEIKVQQTDEIDRALNDMFSGAERYLGKIGTVHFARCSLVIDHGLGRLTVTAEYNPARGAVRICVAGLSADLEPNRVSTSEILLEVLVGTS